MELQKSQIKVELISIEAVQKVIETLNNKVVQGQVVTSYQDIPQQLKTGETLASSSSPPQVNSTP